jgi:CRP-like cAMP-binding protein
MYLHSLFKHLPTTEREYLVSRSELKTYRRNERVCATDERIKKVCLVASGLLRVVVDEDVTTDFVREGDLYLHLEATEPTYVLVAALPTSVYFVPADDIWTICREYPQVALELLRLTIERVANLRKHLQQISSNTSEARIACAMHELTLLAPGRNGGYDKRISQGVIASYTALSREVVNRAMRDLQVRGLLRKDRNAVHLQMASKAGTPASLREEIGPPYL